MHQRESLGLNEAKTAIEAMLQEALKEPKRPVAMAVADNHGELIYFVRMDGAVPLNQEMATRKAYTAAQIGSDTLAFREGLKGANMNFTDFGSTNLTIIQGGVCVRKPDTGVVLGGIGVSGRMAREDETVARAGLNAIKY